MPTAVERQSHYWGRLSWPKWVIGLATDEVWGVPVSPDDADRQTCVARDAPDSMEVSRAEVLFPELPVEPRARSPPPQPFEHHAGHRRRGRRQQYVSHDFLCHVRPRSAREMTRRHRRCVVGSEPDAH
jgi:hypothetical protein